LEWRNGDFWLRHADRPAGEMRWLKDSGVWVFLPTRGAPGRLRRRKLSVAEGLSWLHGQCYDVTAEGEDFLEELLARLEEGLSCRGGSTTIC
jgi:hypothetical protein